MDEREARDVEQATMERQADEGMVSSGLGHTVPSYVSPRGGTSPCAPYARPPSGGGSDGPPRPFSGGARLHIYSTPRTSVGTPQRSKPVSQTKMGGSLGSTVFRISVSVEAARPLSLKLLA